LKKIVYTCIGVIIFGFKKLAKSYPKDQCGEAHGGVLQLINESFDWSIKYYILLIKFLDNSPLANHPGYHYSSTGCSLELGVENKYLRRLLTTMTLKLFPSNPYLQISQKGHENQDISREKTAKKGSRRSEQMSDKFAVKIVPLLQFDVFRKSESAGK
jgi:hypothetical protein